MRFSRRDLAVLLPAVAVAQQRLGGQKSDSGSLPTLRSRTFDFNDLPAITADEKGTRKLRKVCCGNTTRGEEIEIHMSDLAPGQAPHPPHKHLNEEIIFLREGTLEIEINGQDGEFGHGQKMRVGPGSVSYWASSEVHGIRNVGTTWAKYFDIALGPFAE